MIARFPQGVPCSAGCGQIAAAGCIYCRACLDAYEEDRSPDSDPDVHVLTLRERLAGGGRLMSRLERYGPAECGVCGGASLPGRLYCSSRCRYLARYRGQALRVELDGIKATPLEHARRIGMGRSTLYRRLQLGLDPATALTVPVGAWAAQK